MAQLSRPYQIALGAIAVLALVWVVALRGHSSSPSEPAPSSPSPTPAASSSPGAPSRIYHGPAPGVEGLTRDIAKAHGAVATSEKNAQRLGRESAQASDEPSPSVSKRASAGASTGTGSGARAHKAVSSHARAQRHTATKPARAHGRGNSASSNTSANGRAQQQLEVEHQLAHRKTVVLLFWDPKSSVDDSVRSQVLSLGKSSKGKIAVHTALADQVGLFGRVTEVAQVYQTPTILIVGRHGLITTLTGLVDAFTLKQAVREAEHANR